MVGLTSYPARILLTYGGDKGIWYKTFGHSSAFISHTKVAEKDVFVKRTTWKTSAQQLQTFRQEWGQVS